jgi:hypothetical protein
MHQLDRCEYGTGESKVHFLVEFDVHLLGQLTV